MTEGANRPAGPGTGPSARLLARPDILAGGFFIAVAVLGLFLVRDYDMGTAARMGTGYAPRLVCIGLLVLGAFILLHGLRAGREPADPLAWRPLVTITLAMVAFGLIIERAGLVASAVALIAIGSLAGRGVRPLETLLLGAVLVVGAVAVFVWGLGLTMPVWPEF